MSKILYTEPEIQFAVRKLAHDINQDSSKNSNPPVLICILNGAVMFYTDLCKCLHTDCVMDFIRVKSYEGQEQKELTLTKDIETNIEGRRVYLIDDIYDTGNTVKFLVNHLKQYNPQSIIPVTLFKSEKSDYEGDTFLMYGFEKKESDWLIGYGLDGDKGLKRNLPCVMKL